MAGAGPHGAVEEHTPVSASPQGTMQTSRTAQLLSGKNLSRGNHREGNDCWVHLHPTLVLMCVFGFRNWKSPRLATFPVAPVSALPGGATSPLHLPQPRTAISVLIPVCVLEKPARRDAWPCWRADLLLQSNTPPGRF